MALNLSIPLSGISVAQSLMNECFNNIDNSTNENHRKIRTQATPLVADGQGMGVTTAIAQRIVDESQTEDLLTKTSELSFYDSKTKIYTDCQKVIGSTEDSRSLATKIKNFQSRCESLALSPNVTGEQKNALDALQDVCDETARITNSMNGLRQNIEQSMVTSVRQINTQLEIIREYNQAIVNIGNAHSPARNAESAKNIRDGAIRAVGEHIDIQTETMENGLIIVRTKNGVELASDIVNPLSFTPTMGLTPDSTYNSDPTLSTMNSVYAHVGSIKVDMTNAFSYGHLAAFIEGRDRIIPELHQEIDRLVSNFRDNINDIHNIGTGWPPASILKGTRIFQSPSTDAFQGTGTIRIGIVDRTNGTYASHYDLDLTALGPTTVGNLANIINTNLSTLTGNTVTCTCNGATGNTMILSSTNNNYGIGLVSIGNDAIENGTGYGFSRYFGLNDLVVTGAEVSNPGTEPTPGIAGQLAIRSDIAKNGQLLAKGKLNPTALVTVNTTSAVLNGDSSVVKSISDMLLANQTFSAAGTLPQVQDTFMGYMGQIIAANAQDANRTTSIMNGVENDYKQINMDISRTSGVNMLEELSLVLELQQLMAACSKCVEINKKNFEYLINAV